MLFIYIWKKDQWYKMFLGFFFKFLAEKKSSNLNYSNLLVELKVGNYAHKLTGAGLHRLPY